LDDKEREELEELRTIVAGFDKVIRVLAKKYLRDAPRGRLPLESFFELLLAKARRNGRNYAAQEAIRGSVRQVMDQMRRESVVFNRQSIKDIVFIPVLVRRAHRKEISLKKYRALCLRGSTNRGNAAETPEEAYAMFRGILEDYLAKNPDTVPAFKKDLMEEYDMAKFLKDDIVSGFRVIVKFSEVEPEEETDAGSL
jgi:hypothetical protein